MRTPWPSRSAPQNWSPPRSRPDEGFAGVDREVEVLALEVLEGLEVHSGAGIDGFASGDVEPDHAVVPIAHGRLRYLQGVGVLCAS
jgi:hypothetical protein